MDTFNRVDRMVVAGHRGAKKIWPENTALGFIEAIRLGCDLIETDLHFTKDKQIVLIHDFTLDRTTNATGVVEEHTLAELKKLDVCCKCADTKGFVGDANDPRYKNERILTLEEFLDLMKNEKVNLLIEFKGDNLELVDRTMEIFKTYRMAGRSTFTSFYVKLIEYLHDAYGVRTEGKLKRQLKDQQLFVDGPGGTYSKMYSVGLEMPEVTAENVAMLRSYGVHPWAWCPDTEEKVKKCIELGFEGITCNDPRPALKLIRGMNF